MAGNRPVAFAFERVLRRRFQERPGLAVAQGGRLAFVLIRFGALDPAHRVVAHRVDLAEVVKQRGDRGEFSADGAGGQAPAFEVFKARRSGERG